MSTVASNSSHVVDPLSRSRSRRLWTFHEPIQKSKSRAPSAARMSAPSAPTTSAPIRNAVAAPLRMDTSSLVRSPVLELVG